MENNTRARVELGKKGEEIAADLLTNLGYTIVCRNKRIGHSDIDILAEKENTLIFVEVRTKSGMNRGMPEETLTKKKLARMRKTAEIYIVWNHYEGPARLDAVCIVLDHTDNIQHIEHYEGVG